MINFTNSRIRKLVCHQIDKLDDKVILNLSSEEHSALPEEMESLVLEYFLSPCKGDDYFKFRHHAKLELNQIFSFVREIFEIPSTSFLMSSKQIVTALSELIDHHNITSSEILVCLMDNIIIEDQVVSALAIFKPERKEKFLKTVFQAGSGILNSENGIPIGKVDKGCVIFNINSETGYSIKSFDTRNTGGAKFWNESFLNIEPRENEYFKTIQVLDLTKKFIKDELPSVSFGDKLEQIEILNNAIAYFKDNDTYEPETFKNKVFENPVVLNSLSRFDSENVLEDHFDISELAVKKEDKRADKVLKLDRNFHVYIHGDSSKIVNGSENDGRKYYKLYYEREK